MTNNNREDTVRIWTFGELTLTLRLDKNNCLHEAAIGSSDTTMKVGKDALRELSGFLAEFLYYSDKNAQEVLHKPASGGRNLTQLIDLD